MDLRQLEMPMYLSWIIWCVSNVTCHFALYDVVNCVCVVGTGKL